MTLAAFLSFAAAAQADLNSLVVAGKVEGQGGTRPATLRLLCNSDPDDGALSIELWVSQAFKLKDFDYDDFEGPDAAAADRALSHVSLVANKGQTEISQAAAGWYSGDDPDTFVFGLSEPSHHAGKVGTLVKAIEAKHKQIVWVQSAFDKSKRELRASFALDAATVKRIHDSLDECLTPSHPKPKSKK